MGSIFVSNLPRGVVAADVCAYLRSVWPRCHEVNVLQDGVTTQSHKGHAYVFFASHDDAVAAAALSSPSSPPLTLDGAVLRVRVCNNSNNSNNNNSRHDHNTKSDKVTITTTTAAQWTDAPLPPAYMAYPHKRCAFYVPAPRRGDIVDKDDKDDNDDDDAARLAAEHKCSVATPHPGVVTPAVRVVVFASHAAREEALRAAPNVFARCSCPRLAQLLSSALPPQQQTRQQRCSEDTRHDTQARKRARTHGDDSDTNASLRPLTPSQTLHALQELLCGRGRVSVRDRTGVTCVLRVPGYVAALQ